MSRNRTATFRLAACLAVVMLPVGAGLSACSKDADTAGEGTSSSAAAPDAPAANSDVSGQVIGADQAPQGYAAEDFYSVFGALGEPGESTVEPAQCEPLVLDAYVLAKWGAADRAQTAVTMFTRDDGAMILAKVDNTVAPVDAEGCEKFTRSSSSELGESASTYSLEPVDVSVDGAEDVKGVKTTAESVTLDGAEVGGGKVGEEATAISGTVNGKSFLVAGLANASLNDITAVANAQAAKLANG